MAGQIDDFYLVGGTALSLYYFQHRESLDLDFFTHDFKRERILDTIKLLSEKLGKKIELVKEQGHRDRAKIMIFTFPAGKSESLKIDFVQDFFDFIKPPKLINGIKVLSLEDIFLKKIFAITGTSQTEDLIGRKITKGGRQEAKDYYDLYCLSHIFMRLSDFSFKYGNYIIREALVRWFRTFDRTNIKTGLLELKLKRPVDYRDMERHFKKEIDKILQKEIDLI